MVLRVPVKLAVLVLVAAGCGGSSNANLDGGAMLDSGTPPDAGLGPGDAGQCTPATSGLYVLTGSGASLVIVSTDPGGWDNADYIQIVDENGAEFSVSGMTVANDNDVYFRVANRIYFGAIGAIRNRKLTVKLLGAITGDPIASDYYGIIAPNGGAPGLMVSYGTSGAYVGALNVSSGVTLTPGKVPVSSECQLIDFEGFVVGDSYTLTAICRNSITQILNGTVAAPAATGNVLRGMQLHNGALYAMDGLANLYDINLSLIKKARRCRAGTVVDGAFPVLGL